MRGSEQFRVKSQSAAEGSGGSVELAVEFRIRSSVFSMTASVTAATEGGRGRGGS